MASLSSPLLPAAQPPTHQRCSASAFPSSTGVDVSVGVRRLLESDAESHAVKLEAGTLATLSQLDHSEARH